MAEDKFKPRPFKDLKGDERETMQFMMENWKENTIIKMYHGNWLEYIEWFYGNQYSFFNSYSGEIEDLAYLVEREVKNVYNRILPVSRQLWSQFCYPHKFLVEPNTYNSEDVKAADLGTHAILYTNDNRGFQQKVTLGMLWALILGQFYWKEFWNKELVGFIRKSDGKVTEESGDVDYDIINPFNFRPDELAKCPDDWRHTLEGKEVPRRGLEEKFDLPYKTLPAEEKTRARTGLLERSHIIKPTEETVIRLEYVEKKSKRKSEGKFAVGTSSGWLLYFGPNPNPEKQLNIFKVPGIMPILNEQFHESAVKIMQNSQRQLNRLGSMVDEHHSNYRVKAIVPRGVFPPGEFERYTRSGIDFVVVNPGVQPPYWQSPPNLPETTIPWLKFQENEVGASINVRKFSMGEVPKYGQRPSGVFAAEMRQVDDVVLEPNVEEVDNALTKPLKFRLQLIQKHYGAPRLIKTTGENRERVINFLKGTELRSNIDVRVRPGVALFADKQALTNVVMELVRSKLITDKDEALEALQPQFKAVEGLLERKFIDRNQAQRENEILKDSNKPYPKPSEDDNQDVHYEVHNTERKKEEFKLWPKKGQTRLLQHLQETRELIALSIQTVQGMGETSPGGGTSPTGGGPSPEEVLKNIPGV